MTEERRKEIEDVARLAALDIDPESLPTLTAQIDRILAYVSQLDPVPAKSAMDEDPSGKRTTLRSDEVVPSRLLHPVMVNAPAFREGLFVVPKLGALERE